MGVEQQQQQPASVEQDDAAQASKQSLRGRLRRMSRTMTNRMKLDQLDRLARLAPWMIALGAVVLGVGVALLCLNVWFLVLLWPLRHAIVATTAVVELSFYLLW
jgi:hypothetical protein